MMPRRKQVGLRALRCLASRGAVLAAVPAAVPAAVLAAVLTAVLTGCGGDAPVAGATVRGGGLDLIVVSVDTLRADRLGLYGSPRDTAGAPDEAWTPAWLAAQGTLWEQCWAPAGKTVPSLGSFWTGLPPLVHGGISNHHEVLSATLVEALAAEGWEAHAAVANRALHPVVGLARGFSSYGIYAKEREAELAGALLARVAPRVAAGAPLLAWAHFMAPHQPYLPPGEDFASYRDDSLAVQEGAEALGAGGTGTEIGSATGSGAGAGAGELPDGSTEALAALHRAPQSATPARIAALRSLYDAEVRLTSRRVQELLSGLDAQYRAAGRGGLLDNALVVFVADHGEELGDRHGYFPHAKSLYSGVIQVPLVVAGPGVAVGARESRPIALEEVLALLVDGVPPGDGPYFATWQDRYYSARDARWTLVHNPDGDPLGPPEPPLDAAYPYPTVALYDRASDPREQQDVAALHPQETRRLLAALKAWYSGLTIAVGPPPAPSGVPLAELGYADDAAAPGSGAPPWPAERW